MMTGVELQPTQVLGSAWPQHFNKVVAEATWANIQKVGLPEWSDDDQTLAKALQKELKNPKAEGLRTKLQRDAAGTRSKDNTGGGSDDIGDISWNVPTVTLRYPVEHSRPAGPQLGERHRDGHADRAQGRDRRRQGAGDDDARSADAARARRTGVGLLPERADQGDEVRAAHPAAGQAGDLAEQSDHGQVPAGDEEVLLRPVAVPTYLEQLGITYPTVRT